MARFTLVELLTSFGVLALLLSLLVPGLSKARERSKGVVCGSNLRQIALANGMYALDQEGVYVPGAADVLGNLHRWHGSRTEAYLRFDSKAGPLTAYFGEGDAIRACPRFEPPPSGFEVGNGGYGYNNAYVGVETVAKSNGRTEIVNDQRGASADRIRRPAQTLMFADTAFMDRELIEYSFAEARFHPQYGSRADPSIHFRHLQTGNVAWCDGHVTSERRTLSWSSGFYKGDAAGNDIGWFGGSDDNSLFDLN